MRMNFIYMRTNESGEGSDRSSITSDFSSTFQRVSGAELRVSDIGLTLAAQELCYEVSDPHVTASTRVLRGQMDIADVEEGVNLYRTQVRDLRTMQTSNLLSPGLKIVLLLEGESDLNYGGEHVHLRAFRRGMANSVCGAIIMLTRADRFTRTWVVGRRERKLVITLSQQWLQRRGLLEGGLEQFTRQHLGHIAWNPSPRTLMLADQLHGGCLLPRHLHGLWVQSRCLDVVIDAVTAVEQNWPREDRSSSAPGVSEAMRRPAAACGAQQFMRLVALREWLSTAAADGMDVADIARHAGMSIAHLQRHFPAVAGGMSLAQFVRLQRMQRARAALEHGSLSVAQAAELAGYRSSTHFSAAFRDAFGVLPSRLKQ